MRLLVSLPLLAAWASIGVPGASSFVPLRLRLSHRASSPSAFVPRHSTSEAVNGGTAEAEASSEAASETSEPGFVPSSEPASFSVVTEESPLGPVHTLTLQLGPSADASHGSLVLESGRIGRQAAGAVVLTRGETVIYSTCCRDSKPKEGLDGGDFVPLSVDYQERFSSAGMTSGGFLKRDGRLAEHEILTCRLIDRPVRPLIAAGWAHDTQLLSWVLSYDGVRSNEPTAIVASAASCYVSDVPMAKPVGAVQVGMVDGNFVVNPTMEADEKSPLHLMVAGTKDGVLMIEGFADFLTEKQMIQAVATGHEAIKIICEGVEALKEAIDKSKGDTDEIQKLGKHSITAPPSDLKEAVKTLLKDRIDEAYAANMEKDALSAAFSAMSKDAKETISESIPEASDAQISSAMKKLLRSRLYAHAQSSGTRADGRAPDAVRPIAIETSILPKVHGSALFTRGQTQAVATATLGGLDMMQKVDSVAGMHKKKFYLQYTFPPSCVGETGRVGGAGRREIGHGMLAERALLPIVPDDDDPEWPYVVRLESLITESHGSSSMASVCGGSLALMDAGVPVSRHVAGIAMGLLLPEEEETIDMDKTAIVLSDITGSEDALGTMDFKVAGDRDGISAFQLDIKCEGLTVATMERALEQARRGRLHILDQMEAACPSVRPSLPDTVPKITTMQVEVGKIGRVIGAKGATITEIIANFGLTDVNVDRDTGRLTITGYDQNKMQEAKDHIANLCAGEGRGGGGGKKEYTGPPPVEGMVYEGVIKGIHQFGVFLEILPPAEDGSYPGLEGLCHVSELHTERVRNTEGYVNSLNVDKLNVMFMGKNDKGKLQLSRKEVQLQGKKAGEISDKFKPPPVTEEDKAETDVISQAIEGLFD
mmetsp:Transcript_6918/g.14933  ORF Transcript_6918/g.14933 Transcript_6918/m.14933 type:complete len:879 (-) Transcript_6918:47-2683(-)|eukprot:CAMPEP_0113309118 /NCGR_PEP_ID=MMETSP0010_2-20120614/7293_1 /TAXON_ID=216773 ORGANISM="Corethron hystrix, Strain 308" /NCGR_SAMPLE_ID=MMETSP0010_2 /ASSEMBLY_ACC=CAM_ASM_000155 /LENGTH=878 /DNA_ID=CAMNT_0000164313 /DNA_START=33 /DNA_END=2669 /DNA_ORIENTATION=+ /assembly_acc=CAM_ASM_000155